MNDIQRLFWLLATILVCWLLWLLKPVLVPFASAALLAYLGDPLVDRLELVKIGRWQIGRSAAVSVVFVLMGLTILIAVLFLVPMLERQVSQFIQKLPSYLEWGRTQLIPWIEQRFAMTLTLPDLSAVPELIQQHWREAGGLASTLMSYVSQSSLALLGWIANLTLIPVVTFYLLRDWDHLVEHVCDLLPRRYEPTVRSLGRESDIVLGAFIRGQLMVMLALGTIYSLGLWLIGLDLAFLIGMLAGLLSIVPYLGTIIGIITALIAAAVQFGDLLHPALVAVVFMLGQTLEGMVLTPLLVGDRIGLHPVAVIFAVLAGGQLFGFLGVLLALPVAAVIMVLLRHVHTVYKDSELYDKPRQKIVTGERRSPPRS
ncbi:MAG: AI-2E family transporter [Wenzhouxiangellaceae bacterium]